MYVHVTAAPGAKRECVEVCGEQRLKISVREPAKQNLANKRIAALVAEYAHVPQAHVRLVAGHRSPKKVFAVDDINQ